MATEEAPNTMKPAGRWFFKKEDVLNSPSVRSGLSLTKEISYRQQAANFIQDMGQHLRVTQLCINTAIVYTYRFYMFHTYHFFHRNEIALAALFLAAKVEEQPRKLEHVIKMAHICLKGKDAPPLDPRSEAYHDQAQDLIQNENILLQTLGFNVAIDHPHTHVVRCCQLVRASKELAQASYYLATNSLHLTTMCLRFPPTIVACFCIHLACKWSNYKIPLSAHNKEWFVYMDPTVTSELLEQLTEEFLSIYEQCPSRLKRKIKASTEMAREEHEDKMPPMTNGLFTSQPVRSVPAPSSSSVPADPFRNVSMAPPIKLEPGAVSRAQAVRPSGVHSSSVKKEVPQQPQHHQPQQHNNLHNSSSHRGQTLAPAAAGTSVLVKPLQQAAPEASLKLTSHRTSSQPAPHSMTSQSRHSLPQIDTKSLFSPPLEQPKTVFGPPTGSASSTLKSIFDIDSPVHSASNNPLASVEAPVIIKTETKPDIHMMMSKNGDRRPTQQLTLNATDAIANDSVGIKLEPLKESPLKTIPDEDSLRKEKKHKEKKKKKNKHKDRDRDEKPRDKDTGSSSSGKKHKHKEKSKHRDEESVPMKPTLKLKISLPPPPPPSTTSIPPIIAPLKIRLNGESEPRKRPRDQTDAESASKRISVDHSAVHNHQHKSSSKVQTR